MSTVDSISYGTRKKECYRIYDNDLGMVDRTITNVKFLKKKWQKIENFEYSKRKNGKVLSKLILMFPNEWSQEQKEELIQKFLESKFGKKHHFTFCFHGGKDGEVVENAHGHLYYSERILTDAKNRKDPAMSKLGYIKKFVKDWQKECGIDLSKSPKVDRIPMKEWKANPYEARLFKLKIKKALIKEQSQIEITSKKLKNVEMIFTRTKHNYQRKSSKIEHKITKHSIDFLPPSFLERLIHFRRKKAEKERLQLDKIRNIKTQQKFELVKQIEQIINSDNIFYFHQLKAELEYFDIGIEINSDKELIFTKYNLGFEVNENELSQNTQDYLQDFKRQANNLMQFKR